MNIYANAPVHIQSYTLCISFNIIQKYITGDNMLISLKNSGKSPLLWAVSAGREALHLETKFANVSSRLTRVARLSNFCRFESPGPNVCTLCNRFITYSC